MNLSVESAWGRMSLKEKKGGNGDGNDCDECRGIHPKELATK